MSHAPKQFVIYADKAGKWRWTLYAANSKKIADSAESYESNQAVKHGPRLVAAVASDAGIWNGDDKKWEQ